MTRHLLAMAALVLAGAGCGAVSSGSPAQATRSSGPAPRPGRLQSSHAARHHYLFAYFKDDGRDGLHLAYSSDGMGWRALKGDYFDRYMEGRYGVVLSRDLVHWTDASDRLSMPPGARHGTVFEVDAAVAEGLLASSGEHALGSASW